MKSLPAPETAIVKAKPAGLGPRPTRAMASRSRPGAHLALVTPATTALTRAQEACQGIEEQAAEYQHWCDAMVSSVTWIREAIDAQDIDALEEALDMLEGGLNVSQPALASMAELAKELRRRMPKTP